MTIILQRVRGRRDRRRASEGYTQALLPRQHTSKKSTYVLRKFKRGIRPTACSKMGRGCRCTDYCCYSRLKIQLGILTFLVPVYHATLFLNGRSPTFQRNQCPITVELVLEQATQMVLGSLITCYLL